MPKRKWNITFAKPTAVLPSLYYLGVVAFSYVVMCHLLGRQGEMFSMIFNSAWMDATGGDFNSFAVAILLRYETNAGQDASFWTQQMLMLEGFWEFIKCLLPLFPATVICMSIDRVVRPFVPTDNWLSRLTAFAATFLLQLLVLLAWFEPVTIAVVWDRFLKNLLIIAGILLSAFTVVYSVYLDQKREKQEAIAPDPTPPKKDFFAYFKPNPGEKEAIDTVFDMVSAILYSAMYELTYILYSLCALVLGITLLALVLLLFMQDELRAVTAAASYTPLVYVLLLRFPYSPVERGVEWFTRLVIGRKEMTLVDRWKWTSAIFCFIVLVGCFVLQFTL